MGKWVADHSMQHSRKYTRRSAPSVCCWLVFSLHGDIHLYNSSVAPTLLVIQCDTQSITLLVKKKKKFCSPQRLGFLNWIKAETRLNVPHYKLLHCKQHSETPTWLLQQSTAQSMERFPSKMPVTSSKMIKKYFFKWWIFFFLLILQLLS